MPRTAAAMGVEDPFDPVQALPASARLLQGLHRRYGNLGLAAAAYNAGEPLVNRWLQRGGVLPQETRKYVLIITGFPVMISTYLRVSCGNTPPRCNQRFTSGSPAL